MLGGLGRVQGRALSRLGQFTNRRLVLPSFTPLCFRALVFDLIEYMSLQVNLLRLAAGLNGTLSVLHMFAPDAFYRLMYPTASAPQCDNLHRDLQRMWGSYEAGMALMCLGASLSSAPVQRLALAASSLSTLLVAFWSALTRLSPQI